MERRHEVTRLEGFSDAVFGFALTLLVVSLEVPESVHDLINNMRGFLPFALMFAMICWIWYEHQKFFRRYGLQDAWIVTINSFLLFVVLFYVYPLKYLTIHLVGPLIGMVDSRTGEPISRGMERGDLIMMLYSAGVVLIFGSFVAFYRHAWRHRELLALDPHELVDLRAGMYGHMISAGLGAVSIVIVVIAQQTQKWDLVIVAGVIYSMMGPLHGWAGYRSGKAHDKLRKSGISDAKR